MLNILQIAAMNQPSEPAITIPGTRFVASPTAMPLDPPPYTSITDDALIDNAVHKYTNRIRQNALHPIHLHAGQSAPVNGGIGRFFRPQIPEIIGGGLVGINI